MLASHPGDEVLFRWARRLRPSFCLHASPSRFRPVLVAAGATSRGCAWRSRLSGVRVVMRDLRFWNSPELPPRSRPATKCITDLGPSIGAPSTSPTRRSGYCGRKGSLPRSCFSGGRVVGARFGPVGLYDGGCRGILRWTLAGWLWGCLRSSLCSSCTPSPSGPAIGGDAFPVAKRAPLRGGERAEHLRPPCPQAWGVGSSCCWPRPFYSAYEGGAYSDGRTLGGGYARNNWTAPRLPTLSGTGQPHPAFNTITRERLDPSRRRTVPQPLPCFDRFGSQAPCRLPPAGMALFVASGYSPALPQNRRLLFSASRLRAVRRASDRVFVKPLRIECARQLERFGGLMTKLCRRYNGLFPGRLIGEARLPRVVSALRVAGTGAAETIDHRVLITDDRILVSGPKLTVDRIPACRTDHHQIGLKQDRLFGLDIRCRVAVAVGSRCRGN